MHVIKRHEHVKHGYRHFKGRSYRNFNLANYLESLEGCSWEYFDNCQDPTECWNVYENMLKRMLDITCPVKEFKVLDKPDPWMTNYLIERINDKNSLLLEARTSTSILTWRRARMLKNLVNEELDTARKKYYCELSDALVKDSKKFWSTLKDIIPSKSKSKTINLVNNFGNSTPLEETSAQINSFFAEIGPKLAEKHRQDFEFRGERCLEDMPDMVFTDEQIVDCVKEMDVSKSSSIEYLPTTIFKEAVLKNPKRFIKIINLCFSTCIIPTHGK